MARKTRPDSRGDMLLGTLDMLILKTLLPGAGDAAVFLISIGTLLIVSMSAAFVPAWRASRIDPSRALRHE